MNKKILKEKAKLAKDKAQDILNRLMMGRKNHPSTTMSDLDLFIDSYAVTINKLIIIFVYS